MQMIICYGTIAGEEFPEALLVHHHEGALASEIGSVMSGTSPIAHARGPLHSSHDHPNEKMFL